MSESSELTIYDAPFSPYGARIRIWRNLKGVALRLEPPPGGTARSPEYKALIFTGRMPALVRSSGDHLAESQAILSYLEHCFPSPPLVPASAWERAQMQSLMLQCDLYLGPSFFPMFAQLRNGLDAANPPSAWLQKAQDTLLMLERSLSRSGPFLLGADASLADCALAGTSWYLQILPRMFDLAIDLHPTPTFAAWWRMLQQHPAFEPEFAAMHRGFTDFVLEQGLDASKLKH
jgi:glutathione S-transferase